MARPHPILWACLGLLACVGGPEPDDLRRARALWERCAPQAGWGHFDQYPGIQPGDGSHGEFIETRINPVAAADQDGLPEGSILIKANYAAEDPATLESYVVMERVPGLDPRHDDWFYATYSPSGRVLQAGLSDDCIRCHRAAGDGDYVFYNDRY